MSNSTIGTVTAKVTADTTDFDSKIKKSSDLVSATSRANSQAAQKAAQAQAVAMKFQGDAVSQNSLRMVRAMKAESEARADLRKVQALAKVAYSGEEASTKLVAAAMQRLTSAQLEVAAASKKQVSAMDEIPESLKRIAEGIGLIELANKALEAVTGALEFGEQIERASQKTGLAVGTLSTLHYAAAVTGGDFDGMTAAVTKMEKMIGAATEGNKKAQAVMASLGLNATDLAGRSDGVEVAFKKVTETLADLPPGINRSKLAMDVFGKAGAEQIATLSQVGGAWDQFAQKAADAGVRLDGTTAEQLEATQQRLKDLEQHIKGAGLAFTTGLVPGLSQMLSVASGGKTQMAALENLGSGIARGMSAAAAAVYGLASGMETLFAVSEGGRLTKGGSKDSDAARQLAQQAAEFRDLAIGKSKPDEVKSMFESSKAEGGGDYEGLGDLSGAEEKANELRFKQMEADLARLGILGNQTAKSEYEYWIERIDQFKKGSAQYNAILEKQDALAKRGAAAAHEKIVRGREGQRTQNSNPDQGDMAIYENAQDVTKSAQSGARAQDERADMAAELVAVKQRNLASLQELSVNDAVGLAITRIAAASQRAAIHTASFGAELARLNAKAQQVANASYLTDAEKERQLGQISIEGQSDLTARARQILQDHMATTAASGSSGVGAKDALDEFVDATRDAAREMHEIVTSTLSSVNKTLLDDITGERKGGEWTGVGRGLASDVAGGALRKGEGSILGAFGLGSAKPDGSASNPLHVIMANLPGLSMPSIASSAASSSMTSGPSIKSIGQMLFGMLPGFASGGAISADTMAVIGEKGPELFMPNSGGTIVPNSKLLSKGGGGDTHYHIDARGSNDPAQVRAQVEAGLRAYAPHMIKASVKAGRDDNSRRAATSRR
jgi:hypothetical protein